MSHTKDGRENIVTNLGTDDIEELFEKLDGIPKPDILVASPMCMSFSRGSAMKNGSTGFELNEDGSIRPRENFGKGTGNIVRMKSGRTYLRTTPEKSEENGKLGTNAIKNTLAIIERYEPKV